jgi:hypothetical protein
VSETKCTADKFCDAMSNVCMHDDSGRIGFASITLIRGWEHGPGEEKDAVVYRYGRKRAESRFVRFCPFCGGDLDHQNAEWRKQVVVTHDRGFTTVDERDVPKTLAELGPSACAHKWEAPQ